jgi:hypothetical protein
MFRPNILIMLVLLAIMAGNPAFAAVDEPTLDDIGAVAELRIDADSVAAELGADPELPDLIASLGKQTAVVAEQFGNDYLPYFTAKSAVCTQPTRAPPVVARA